MLKEMETLSAKWSKGREVLSGQASTQESQMSGKGPRDFSGPKKRNRSKVMYVKFKEGVRLHPGRTAEFGSTGQLVQFRVGFRIQELKGCRIQLQGSGSPSVGHDPFGGGGVICQISHISDIRITIHSSVKRLRSSNGTILWLGVTT